MCQPLLPSVDCHNHVGLGNIYRDVKIIAGRRLLGISELFFFSCHCTSWYIMEKPNGFPALCSDKNRTLNVAPLISVRNGLSYTMSNCMCHERAKRSECAHAVIAKLPQVTRNLMHHGITILHGPKAWCMVSCTTPVSQSECRDSRSTSTKGNNAWFAHHWSWCHMNYYDVQISIVTFCKVSWKFMEFICQLPPTVMKVHDSCLHTSDVMLVCIKYSR